MGRLGADTIRLMYMDSQLINWPERLVINYQIIKNCYGRDILIIVSSVRERTRFTNIYQSPVPYFAVCTYTLNLLL